MKISKEQQLNSYLKMSSKELLKLIYKNSKTVVLSGFLAGLCFSCLCGSIPEEINQTQYFDIPRINYIQNQIFVLEKKFENKEIDEKTHQQQTQYYHDLGTLEYIKSHADSEVKEKFAKTITKYSLIQGASLTVGTIALATLIHTYKKGKLLDSAEAELGAIQIENCKNTQIQQ